MKLFLKAKSKNGVGYYYNDWMTLAYHEGSKKQYLNLIHFGETRYSQKDLKCECEGELAPYMLIKSPPIHASDYEIISKHKISEEKLIEIFRRAKISIDVSPIPTVDMQNPANQELVSTDVFFNGKGLLILKNNETVEFCFTPQVANR